MARRSEHSREQLAEMILDAAHTIVTNEGHKGLTARKIAQEIGYTVGTLYLVFNNQDDIVLHINGRTLDDLYQCLSKSIQHCRQPNQCLLAMAKAYLQYSQQNPALWSMIYEHRLPDAHVIPSWYQDKIDLIFELVESQVNSLIDKAAVRSQLAQVLWAGVHGIAILANTGKLDSAHVTKPEKLIELQIKTIIAGLQEIQTS